MPTSHDRPAAIPAPALLRGVDGPIETANAPPEGLRFRDLVESMPDHVLLLDRDGLIVYANPALARDLGISAETLTGPQPENPGFAAPEFDAFRGDFNRVIEAGEPITGERTAETPSGRRTYSYTMTPFAGSDGRVASVMLTSRDVTPLMEVQKALMESEAKYRNLVELSPDAILIHRDGAIVFANPASAVLVGAARPEDLVGRPILEIVHPLGRGDVEWNIRADLRGEVSPITTVEIVRDDGTLVTVQGRGALISFEGSPSVQVVLRDVTEERRAESALRTSEERLRLAQESANIGIWDRDAATDRVTISPEFLRRYGQEAMAIETYQDWEQLVHPDDREQVEDGRRAALATGEPLDLEFRVILPSGEARWLQFKGQGVNDRQGALERVIGVLIDVTDRRRTEDALRKREQTLQGIFRAAPLGIGMASHRVITEANDQLCRMTGYARDELIGHDARLLYPSDEAYESVGQRKYALIAETGTGTVETQWRRRDGNVLEILLSSSPVDLARPHDDVIFNALDITRLRESERALASFMDDLQRSNEELQRFAYVASHDLQEPLRSIISFSELLERRYRGRLDTDADEFIGFIIKGGNRLQRLIEDLLQLSRVETKAQPLAPTDVGEVVTEALRLMQTPIREAGATITVEEMPTAMADAAQLTQVFTNLVGNAIKYCRPDLPPQVRISAERTGQFWRFAVTDNGIGIEKEYFDRIFVIFQRLHTRDEYEGTGIGLAVVRKIVERHGGRIGVESTPGEGSTFFFTIPAV